jgi:hypothetical protein
MVAQVAKGLAMQPMEPPAAQSISNVTSGKSAIGKLPYLS